MKEYIHYAQPQGTQSDENEPDISQDPGYSNHLTCAPKTYNTKLFVKFQQYIKLAVIYLHHAPNYEKFALRQEILQRSYMLLSHIVRCSKKFHKKTDFIELDIAHQILRELWFTFYNLGYFSYRKSAKDPECTPAVEARRFAAINSLLDDMGAMIGAWIKNYLAVQPQNK